MKSSFQIPLSKLSLAIILIIFILSACRGGGQQPADETVQEGVLAEENTDQGPGPGFQEIPLPDGFPASFPIPDGSRIGYSGRDAEEGCFQILVYFANSLEEGLEFYRQNLPANGWELLEEEAFEDGHGMTVSNEEYDGELYFVLHEESAYADVSLEPAGTTPDSMDITENFGVSSQLGETGTDFPADFPLPPIAEPVPLSDKLAAEGYQLAFTYPDMPELAYIQFSAAIVGAGWMIGDLQMGTNSYTMPFSNPETGFEGYALLTSNPGVAGVSSINGCIVAFHTGTYP